MARRAKKRLCAGGGEKKREDEERQEGTEAGSKKGWESANCGGEKKKVVSFFPFLVFINSAALELRRN